LERRVKTGGSGRTKSQNCDEKSCPAKVFFAKMLGVCLIIVGFIFGILAGSSGCFQAQAQESKTYQFMYTVWIDYKDGKATLQFTLEDLNDTSKGHPEAGAKVYLYDMYLKDYADTSNGGNWQDNVDFRQANLIYGVEADFGMGDEPYAEADITDIYNNSNGFKKVNSENIQCKKTVTDTKVTFSGSSYMVMFNYSIIPNDVADDDESRYLYLEGKDPGDAVKADHEKIEDAFVAMKTVSAEYMVNRDNKWKQCDNAYRYYTSLCADFNFSDFNVGDIISYRVKYEDGGYSAVIEHKITDLNVDVDPNGGSLDGKTAIYQCFSDGSNGNDVQIATEYEEVELFPSMLCEREGYTFQGFEFTEGEGEIVEVVKYGFMAYVNYTDTETGKKIRQKYRMTDKISYRYSSADQVRNYIWSVCAPKETSILQFTKDDIEVYQQRRVFYYVRSDQSYVRVRAVWKPDRVQKKISLIKLSSSMYNSSLFRRTDGDESWFSASKKLELGKTYGGMENLLHVKIYSDGKMEFV
jgi:hypothetical protein